MKLDTTTRKLEVLLAGTVSTTACPVVACYRDENRNAPQNLGAVPSATQDITVSSVTASTFISAPSVNTIVRVPERISFKNADVSTHTVTFRLNDNTTTFPIWSPTLLPGESAFYDEGRGWYAQTASGGLKQGGISGPSSSTDNAVARWDGATGTAIQNSAVIIDDSNNVSGVVNLTNTGNLTAGDNVADVHTITGATTLTGTAGTNVLNVSSGDSALLGAVLANYSSSSGGEKLGVKQTGGAGTAAQQVWNNDTSGDNTFVVFATETSTTIRGSITYNRGGGLTSFNVTSDERAKIVKGLFQNSGALIDSVPVYLGRMNDASIDIPTMKAHELQAVAPYAVTGEKGATKADGTPLLQQVSHGSLVPLMWAEIQSLRARLTALENK